MSQPLFCLRFTCANIACEHHATREATERPETDNGLRLDVTWKDLKATPQCAGWEDGE